MRQCKGLIPLFCERKTEFRYLLRGCPKLSMFSEEYKTYTFGQQQKMLIPYFQWINHILSSFGVEKMLMCTLFEWFVHMF